MDVNALQSKMSRVNSVKEAVNKKRERIRESQLYINTKRAEQEVLESQLIRLNNEKKELERKTILAVDKINEDMNKLLDQLNVLRQEETEIHSNQNKTLLNLRNSQKNEDELVTSIYKTSMESNEYEEEAKRLHEYATDLLNFAKAKKELVYGLLETANTEQLDRIYEKRTKQLIKQSLFKTHSAVNSTEPIYPSRTVSATIGGGINPLLGINGDKTAPLTERVPQFTIQITKPIPIPTITSTHRDRELYTSGNTLVAVDNSHLFTEYSQQQPLYFTTQSPLVSPHMSTHYPVYPSRPQTLLSTTNNPNSAASISPSPVSSPVSPANILGLSGTGSEPLPPNSGSHSLYNQHPSYVPTLLLPSSSSSSSSSFAESQTNTNANANALQQIWGATEFVQHSQIEFQNNVLNILLSHEVSQLPVTIRGLPGTPNSLSLPPGSINSQENLILSAQWTTIQETVSIPIIYTWDEYFSSLVPTLNQLNISLTNCAYHTLLKIPRELLVKILQLSPPNNIYCAIKYWEYNAHANFLVIVDNCAEELIDIRTISDVTALYRNSEVTRYNFVKSAHPRLIGPNIQYDKMFEDYAKFLFPQRTNTLCVLMKSLKTSTLDIQTQTNPLIPHYITIDEYPTLFIHLSKLVKDKILSRIAAAAAAVNTETPIPKRRGRPPKNKNLSPPKSGDGSSAVLKDTHQSILASLPRLDELVDIIMNTNNILTKDSSYFINLNSLDRFAPLSIPPYHFLDNAVKIHYKKSVHPEMAHYPNDSDCFKPVPITVVRSNTCRYCECSLDFNCPNSTGSSSSSLSLSPSYTTPNACGYTHCRCFELSCCIPCLILLWIAQSGTRPPTSASSTDLNSFMNTSSVTCSRCNYSWSLSTLFPVKK
jgi:hypothetical protein